jgi:EmrB/QacA subfamily drug resistance transporter
MTLETSPPTTTTAGAPAAAPWRALPVLLTGTFLTVLDFFVVNVALPSVQTELGASDSALEWIVAGYGLSFAALLFAAGQLGDRWGRRRLFTVGIALFTVTSAACGLAVDPGTLVAARIAQGAASALVAPTVLALIGTLFSGADRARAIGLYATVAGVAAVGGQLVGGLLLTVDPGGLGWRTIFLVNVPFGVAAVVLTPRLVPSAGAPTGTRIDVLGLLLVSGGLTALVLPLMEGRQQGWPAWTWESLVAAPVLLAAFALRQRALVRRSRPALLDPALFSSRAFDAGMLAQLVFWCGQASYFVVLALYLQQGRGLSPLGAGCAFTLVAAPYLVTSVLAPGLVARWGRYVVTAGALLLAAGHADLALAVQRGGAATALAAIAPGMALAGAGMGLCIPALTSVVLGAADPRTAGAVSGALSAVQQIGNAVGVAVIGMVYFGALAAGVPHAFTVSLDALAAVVTGLALLSLLLPRGRGR